MLRVTVDAENAIELRRLRKVQDQEDGEQREVHDIDADVAYDITAEVSAVCVHVRGVHKYQHQPEERDRRRVVVTAEHPVPSRDVDVRHRVEIVVPRLRPQHDQRDHHTQHSCEEGEDDGAKCARAQQGRGGTIRGQLVRRLGHGAKPGHHEDADANVHGDPDVLAKVASVVEVQQHADARQREAIDHEVLERGQVRGQARAALPDHVHHGHQGLAIPA
mmetsp:Transcript_7028/g.17993  ORF Transcript_7028/g.17993 Transcript_7028/m.17993 type:complete len:219 (+) Transcript_7028:727-1383(+)